MSAKKLPTVTPSDGNAYSILGAELKEAREAAVKKVRRRIRV